MLHAQKAALQNSVRQRLVGIRQKELEYYTLNCRSVGNQAALIAGFAYSGIHYHYLLEHQYGWQLSEEDSIEEVIFLSLLTMSLGCALQVSILSAVCLLTAPMAIIPPTGAAAQTVVLAALVSILAPALALRGPDGSLHDAVLGMQKWTSFVIVLFLVSIVLYAAQPPPSSSFTTCVQGMSSHRTNCLCVHRLQLGALSFTFGHSQMGPLARSTCSVSVMGSIYCTLHYASVLLRKFALSPNEAVSGAFFRDNGQWQSRPFRDRGLSCRKSSRVAPQHVDEFELVPLTGMEFLDGEAPAEAPSRLDAVSRTDDGTRLTSASRLRAPSNRAARPLPTSGQQHQLGLLTMVRQAIFENESPAGIRVPYR